MFKRDIRRPSSTRTERYTSESKTMLKIKRLLRDGGQYILDKYSRSKFAYPPIKHTERLEGIIIRSQEFRNNKGIGMFSSPVHFDNLNMETRLEHLLTAAINARYVARELGLNEDLAYLMALKHDDHISHGHQGEKDANGYAKNRMLGYISHNGLGAINFMYKRDYPGQLRMELKAFYPDMTDEQINKETAYLIKIAEAALTHDGESIHSTYDFDSLKTDEGISNEIIRVFTNPTTRKKLHPSTREAALIKNIDKITFACSDYLDGRRLKRINRNNPDYERIFEAMGISEEIYAKGDKDLIVSEIRRILLRDLVNNSKGKRIIKFSKEMDELLNGKGGLIELNYQNVTKTGLSDEDLAIYPKAKEQLIDLYAEVLEETGIAEYQYSGDSESVVSDSHHTEIERRAKLISTVRQYPRKYIDIVKRIVHDCSEAQIREEVDFAIKMNNGDYIAESDIEDYTSLEEYRIRINKFRHYLRQNHPKGITNTEKDRYISELIVESRLTPEESKRLYEDRKAEMLREMDDTVRRDYSYLSEEEIQKFISEESERREYIIHRIETVRERFGRYLAFSYVLDYNDPVLIMKLEEEGIVPSDVAKKLQVSYGSEEFKLPSEESFKNTELAKNLKQRDEDRKSASDTEKE